MVKRIPITDGNLFDHQFGTDDVLTGFSSSTNGVFGDAGRTYWIMLAVEMTPSTRMVASRRSLFTEMQSEISTTTALAGMTV
ncbi:hypothetical protein ACVWWO_005825 [Bradyrhizobium sp. F1.13.1]